MGFVFKYFGFGLKQSGFVLTLKWTFGFRLDIFWFLQWLLFCIRGFIFWTPIPRDGSLCNSKAANKDYANFYILKKSFEKWRSQHFINSNHNSNTNCNQTCIIIFSNNWVIHLEFLKRPYSTILKNEFKKNILMNCLQLLKYLRF